MYILNWRYHGDIPIHISNNVAKYDEEQTNINWEDVIGLPMRKLFEKVQMAWVYAPTYHRILYINFYKTPTASIKT